MPLSSGTNLGRYKILARIGAGGMGEVYRAKDQQLGRHVAIKVLPEKLLDNRTALKRLEREARAVASLSHPNILSIHDFGNYEGRSYVVTELLEGQTLKSLIHKGALPHQEALKIGLCIAEGLYAAHSKGLIHRDLKPDNIFVTADGRIKILDFGLALSKPNISGDELSGASTASGISSEGMVNGTVPYMSPEQLRGKTIDNRSDIFSFGCVFYEMIFGRPPFLRESAADSVAAILRENPELRHDTVELPAGVTRILRSCLEKDPEQRLPDAHRLVMALNETLYPSGVPSIAGTDMTGRRMSGKTRRIALATGGTVIVFSFLLLMAYKILPLQGRNIDSLVVLPLTNMSGDPQDDVFVNGITEEITARLARIQTLRVISRTSATFYKESKMSLKQIAKELDVDAVLEGSFRKTDGRVRIVTNLVEANSERSIWSKTYDYELRDILFLQNELAQNVSAELRTKLTPEQQAQLRRSERILPDAYDAYLRGLGHEKRADYSHHSVLKQIDFFRQAIDLDPNFALAYASLSQAHSVMQHFRFESLVDHASKARVAVDRALEIDPNLPEARLAFGYYFYWCLKDYDSALEQFAMARKDLPNNIQLFEGMAYVQRRLGNCDEALKALERALLVSPNDLRIVTEIANTLSMLRRYSEADKFYDRAIVLGPDQIFPYLYKAENYFLWDGRVDRAAPLFKMLPKNTEESELNWFTFHIYSKDYESALEHLRSIEASILDDQAYFLTKDQLVGFVYELANQPQKARVHYQKARTVLETKLQEKPDDPRILSSLGLVYAALNLADQAIEKGKLATKLYPIEKDRIEGVFRVMDLAKIYSKTGNYNDSLDQLEPLLRKPGLISVPLLKLDPAFARLHKQPRFLKLADRYSTR